MNEAVRHLLADFEEAFRVYERLSANAERRAGNEPAAPVAIEPAPWAGGTDAAGGAGMVGGASDEDAAGGVGAAGGMLVLAGGTAAVLGCAIERDEVAREALRQLGQAQEAGRLGAGVRVYTIVVTDAWELAATDPTFDAVAGLCAELGLVWSGGLAVGGGAVVAAQAAAPRMGRKRRARSEGIDQLIAAVRTGVGVDELPGAAGDIIDASCSMPRFVYQRKFPATKN